MAKYQKYTEYQDSGLEWLGDLPNHWEIKKLVWFFSAEKGKNGQLLTKEYCGLNTGEFPVYSGQTENNGIMGSINSYEFDVGDNGVLFSTTVGAKAMTLSYLQGKFSLSQNCMIIKPRKNNINTRFYYYHCQPLFAKERALIPEHMQASFRVEDLYSYRISLPPIIEQVQIANFLDYETAKIDSLIEKQQQLIELLKEKRQAVISHAVTKGLNPNVMMKDSGVEWLGQVPEHWGITKLKWKALTTSGSTPTTSKYELYYENGNIPWIRTTDLNNSDLYETPISITSKAVNDTACSILPINSILIAMYGGAGSIGKHALLKFESTINQAVCGVLPSKYFNSDYLHRFYEFYRPFWMIGAMGTRKDPNIGQDHIKEATVLLPPLEEQEKIAKYILDIQIAYDNLTNRAEAAIQLMQERRTALISTAVTGKIDVRNWQNPTEAKMEFSA